ncbi:hypothetical protein K466DRAFT_46256 [Polyporus arcularius HHB13444]|uniref:F-box domain-containing protein n=1 Tax=Polyporus arcularius HHB13444 TaxID=1314778 RepID=A0A5C3PLB2_9APHY|nr:hypothetical protein K466DRAFT_46256 [Polyporus arcularius HHB13444]
MTASILDLSPDLLTLIFAHCLPESLINLAATCRRLSEHALSQIWSTIPSFGTLAYTLPRELWVQEVVKESDGITHDTLSFARPIDSSALARFRKYAPYVKIVDDRGPHQARFTISPSAWDNLEDVLPPNCLPNLQSIHKFEILPVMVEPMHIFLCNSLRNLKYEIVPPRLIRWKDPVPDPAKRWITRFFAGFPSIAPMRLISFQFLGSKPGLCLPATLVHLATISTLHTLSITLLSDDYPDGVFLFDGSPFASLRTVKIQTNSTLLCAAFLREIRSSLIETLEVDSSEPVTPHDFRALATVIADCPSAHVLKRLTVGFGPHPSERQDQDPVPIPPGVFAILHRLRDLEEVILKRGCYAALDDAALAATVKAWIRIRVAKLCSSGTLRFGVSDAPRVTLSGLAAIKERCQAIETIEIPLANITHAEVDHLLTLKPPRIYEPVIDYMCEGLGLFRTACPLKSLGVGPSVLLKEDITGVAAVLSQWFPWLHKIHYLTELSGPELDILETSDGVPIDPQVEEQQWIWSQVAWSTDVYASIREEEQKWPYWGNLDEAVASWVLIEHSDATE